MLLKNKPVYKELDIPGWERVIFCEDSSTNLKAFISIHSTKFGPSLGGCRMWPYTSEKQALNDCLRLSQGMTYKSIWADLPLGGGKSCIIADPKIDKTPVLFEAMGNFVEYVGGSYICAEDVGTTLEDLKVVSNKTNYVASTKGSGDPSPMTAHGCFVSIVKTLDWYFGDSSIKGRKFGVLGLGKVGYALTKSLIDHGATVFGSDINPDILKKAEMEFKNFHSITQDQLLDYNLDVFVPCALGGILNDQTIDQMKSKIVAGSANNQLLEPRHGDLLHQKGILYAPDYIINSGGLINIFCELDGPYDIERAKKLTEKISDRLVEIYEQSNALIKPTHLLADQIAQQKLRSI